MYSGVKMSDPIDASKHIGDDALDKRKRGEEPNHAKMLSARGFSAIMHREAAIRTSLRRSGPGDKGGMLGGLYLAPNMRRALAAMLRGEPVTAQERAALAHAASLLPKDEGDETVRLPAQEHIWPGMTMPANSNLLQNKGSVRGLIIPVQPHRPVKENENHVLVDLGLDPEEGDDD